MALVCGLGLALSAAAPAAAQTWGKPGSHADFPTSDTGDLTGSVTYLCVGNDNLSNAGASLYIHDSRNRLTSIESYLRGGVWPPRSSL